MRLLPDWALSALSQHPSLVQGLLTSFQGLLSDMFGQGMERMELGGPNHPHGLCTGSFFLSTLGHLNLQLKDAKLAGCMACQ